MLNPPKWPSRQDCDVVAGDMPCTREPFPYSENLVWSVSTHNSHPRFSGPVLDLVDFQRDAEGFAFLAYLVVVNTPQTL